MKHIKRFNEINEGLKDWVLAGALALTSLSPRAAERVKTEFAVSKSSIKEASGKEAKNYLAAIEKIAGDIRGKNAKGESTPDEYFQNNKRYVYTFVDASSENEAVEKCLEMFKSSGKKVVKIYSINLPNDRYIIFGEELRD